ncbi:zebrafish testis-expressed 38 [Carcharodon carcharias]|uniref:zebrafish testis-expressed 38 n=1 Tax=Carcharodon carcharias TaxID=13397 RepID=UPI001B7E4FD1|nr:zebrafish testis-expressed 38 [Carcharodon carcharias]
MATAQQMRASEKQISGWSAIFPNDVTTQHQSLVFIKRMMAVGVSCITYLRGIFPEDAYRTRYLEGMCVKILREDSRFPGASKVVKWMMGCFDALEKRFLRTIILGVHRDPEDPNSIIESYQFKFKYTADGPKLDILSNVIGDTEVSLQDTKKASILLIRKLFVLMQSLEILPNDVSLTMKLFYYDEVTPPDYQPPGFKQGECDAVWFEGTPVHFKVGDVPTPFHMMKVRVTTEKETMEQLEKENMLNEETETSLQGMEEVKSAPNTGVKQGCVITSTLFTIFLTVIVHLIRDYLLPGVSIQYRLDEKLFNLGCFWTKTKLTTMDIRDLQFADDHCVMAHSVQDMQKMLDLFNSLYKRLSLSLCIARTKFLHLPSPGQLSIPCSIHIDGVALEYVQLFPYLGSHLSQGTSIDEEVQHQVNCASAALFKLC